MPEGIRGFLFGSIEAGSVTCSQKVCQQKASLCSKQYQALTCGPINPKARPVYMTKRLNRKALLWLALLVLPARLLWAAPSAADLLAACEDSLQNGFKDERGMLCVWYVTPCACDAAIKPGLPRVCLPSSATPEALATEVVRALRQRPELASMSAEAAAATILAPRYPCPH